MGMFLSYLVLTKKCQAYKKIAHIFILPKIGPGQGQVQKNVSEMQSPILPTVVTGGWHKGWSCQVGERSSKPGLASETGFFRDSCRWQKELVGDLSPTSAA